MFVVFRTTGKIWQITKNSGRLHILTYKKVPHTELGWGIHNTLDTLGWINAGLKTGDPLLSDLLFLFSFFPLSSCFINPTLPPKFSHHCLDTLAFWTLPAASITAQCCCCGLVGAQLRSWVSKLRLGLWPTWSEEGAPTHGRGVGTRWSLSHLRPKPMAWPKPMALPKPVWFYDSNKLQKISPLQHSSMLIHIHK